MSILLIPTRPSRNSLTVTLRDGTGDITEVTCTATDQVFGDRWLYKLHGDHHPKAAWAVHPLYHDIMTLTALWGLYRIRESVPNCNSLMLRRKDVIGDRVAGIPFPVSNGLSSGYTYHGATRRKTFTKGIEELERYIGSLVRVMQEESFVVQPPATVTGIADIPRNYIYGDGIQLTPTPTSDYRDLIILPEFPLGSSPNLSVMVTFAVSMHHILDAKKGAELHMALFHEVYAIVRKVYLQSGYEPEKYFIFKIHNSKPLVRTFMSDDQFVLEFTALPMPNEKANEVGTINIKTSARVDRPYTFHGID